MLLGLVRQRLNAHVHRLGRLLTRLAGPWLCSDWVDHSDGSRNCTTGEFAGVQQRTNSKPDVHHKQHQLVLQYRLVP